MPLRMSLQTLQKERNTILGLVVDYFRHLWSDVWFYGKTLSVTVAGKLPGESGVLFPPAGDPSAYTFTPSRARATTNGFFREDGHLGHNNHNTDNIIIQMRSAGQYSRINSE